MMKLEDEIEMLKDQALSLEKAIGDIDHEIGHWLPRMDTAPDSERTVRFIQQRYEIRGDHMFALGKVSAQIDELERRIQERDERVHSELPVADREFAEIENRLDWLNLDDRTPEGRSSDGLWQEPDHDRR